MKRHEKLALLTKVVQGNVTEHTKQQLRQSVDTGATIAIVKYSTGKLMPNDEVNIQEGDKLISMTYLEFEKYVDRRGYPTVFVLPDNGRK